MDFGDYEEMSAEDKATAKVLVTKAQEEVYIVHISSGAAYVYDSGWVLASEVSPAAEEDGNVRKNHAGDADDSSAPEYNGCQIYIRG
jgi:hypothetical protein